MYGCTVCDVMCVLYRLSFTVGSVNWISGCEPVALSFAPHRMDVQVKLRHGPTLVGAVVEREGPVSVISAQGSNGGAYSYRVTLQRKDKGIAPGQFAAFYSEHVVGDGDSDGDCNDGFSSSGSSSSSSRNCLGAGVISMAG